MSKTTNYLDAGVNIFLGDESVKKIAGLAKQTFNQNVIRDIGLFGSFFKLNLGDYSEPILVSSVDGVGTKLKLAFMSGKHDTIGEDLVNHCVNDIMTSGADPLFFLDYIATGKLDKDIIVQIVAGMARGCKNTSCALIGGETAEMPDFYQAGEYDISGTIVGVIDREKIIDGSNIKSGDILIALPANGIHTNGYSLVRKIFFELNQLSLKVFFDGLGCTLGDELLKVHRCYQRAINVLKNEPYLHGMAHITGGGIEGNTNRILPKGSRLNIQWDAWDVPEIFKLIARLGNVEENEMRKVFNLGVGFIFIVKKNSVDEAIVNLKNNNENPFIIGEVL